jgi:hypothetical protein
LKGSKNTSAPGTTKDDAPRSANGARNPPSRPVEGFSLSGASDLPDPKTHAYRKDLADTALAGRVIASHYADPLVRHLIARASFLPEPDNDAKPIAELRPGDEIRMLDMSRGWAWGYGPDGRVGYIRAEAVGG